MKRTTITIETKTRKRALEIVNVLSPLVLQGETIEYAIEEIEEEKKKPAKKVVKR